MEKKVIISESFYNKLINDIETFGFKNSNNEYKLNEFYNTVIINTHRYRNENQNQIINKIKDILLNNDNSLINNVIVDNIKDLKNDPYFNQSVIDLAINISNNMYNNETIENNKKNIFVRGTKHTDDLLEEIANSALDTPVATVFRNILYEYMSYPMYIRERILFYDIYLKLKDLKDKNMKCIIESKQVYKNYNTNETYRNSFEMSIYDIKQGKEEYHTYLIGIGKNTNNKYNEDIMSMKLSNINKVISLNRTYSFSKEDKENIQKRLFKGPEWVNGNESKIVIEFTEYGLDLLKNLYKDRPTPESKDGNVFTYIYNEKAMLNYLKQFGRHAKVIEPSTLKDKLKDFYTKAYNEYK